MLEADRSRLAYIKARIVELERALFALRTKETQVQGRLDAYNYPVLTLPNEMVSEIFIHFLPPYPAELHFTGTNSPTSLMHICSQWREVALATPGLWRVITLREFRVRSIPHIPYDRQCQIADVWLGRSGTCPLSITIMNRRTELWMTWTAHRMRVERLTLSHAVVGQEGMRSASADRLMDGPMPLLIELDLSCTPLDDRVAEDSIALLRPGPTSLLAWHNRDVPRLRSICLSGVAAATMTFPWEQLTSLTMEYIEPIHCDSILRHTTNLVDLILSFWHSPGPGAHLTRSRNELMISVASDIILPHLQSLVLNNKYREWRGFLDTFMVNSDLERISPPSVPRHIVPALRSLKVRERFLEDNPINYLTSFISKSGCRLQHLSIVGGRKISENTYLLAFPNIPEISFEYSYLFGTYSDDSRSQESIDLSIETESDLETNSDSDYPGFEDVYASNSS